MGANLIFSKKTTSTGPLLLRFLQKAESEYLWALLDWGLLMQNAGVRDRASEANKEEKPKEGCMIEEDRLFNPTEASEEPNEMHIRGNGFSLVPTPSSQSFSPQGTILHMWTPSWFPWCPLLCHQQRSAGVRSKWNALYKTEHRSEEGGQSDFCSLLLRPRRDTLSTHHHFSAVGSAHISHYGGQCPNFGVFSLS